MDLTGDTYTHTYPTPYFGTEKWREIAGVPRNSGETR